MMKKRKIPVVFLCFIMLISQHFYIEPSQRKPFNQPINSLKNNQDNELNSQENQDQDTLEENQIKTALMLFTKIEPTISIYEKKVEQIYGPAGINIPEENLLQIKKAYCYLEFLIKIEKVKNNTQYTQYKKSFEKFITAQKNGESFFPTTELVYSDDWKSIPVKTEDFINSPIWQICLQGIVCDSTENITLMMVEVIEVQNQIATFLQNIETAYPTQDYTELRLYLESIELQILLQLQQRQNYIDQTNKFKNLTTNKLDQAITQFKKTDFYMYSHNLQKSQTTQNKKTKNKESAVIPSPAQEQILFYFMLIHIQSTLQNMLNITNLQAILSTTSLYQINPNLFAYNQKDFIYLNDFLTLKELIENNKKNPITTTIKILPAYEEDLTTTTPQTKEDNKKSNNSQSSDKEDQKTAEQANAQLTEKIFTKDFPTNSIYEKTIDTIYGPSGLNVSEKTIQKIKNTYCYLEFLVKLDKVSFDKKFYNYAPDFKKFTSTSSKEGLLVPTQDLISSHGWQSIKVSEQDILNSPAWQGFLKLATCDAFDSTTQFIIDIAEVNLQMTGYLANIEAGYSDDEFTQMRLYSESIQLYELLQTNQKNRYVKQCKDWKTLNKNQLQKAIESFKKEELYQSIHGDQNSQPMAQQKKPGKQNKVASTTQGQVCSYFMLINIQKDVYDTMQLTNLKSMLNQANSDAFSLNFFMYQKSDFIYLYDYITLSNLIEENKIDLQNSPQEGDLDIDNEQENDPHEVVIQKTKNPFAKTNKASARFFNKKGKASADFFKENGKILGKELTKGIKNINTEISKMSNTLATEFIKMSGAFTYGFVMISGSKAAAEKARHQTIKKMNAHKNILTTILTVMTVYTIGIVLFPFSPLLITGYAVGSVVVDERVKKPLMKAMMVVMMPIMIGMEKMTDAFTEGFIEMSAGLTLAGCEMGLLYMNYTPCGLFIKAVTPDLWKKMNANVTNPEQRANNVRAKLNKYRGTLNIIMSIVITILITVVIIAITAGAGAAYTAAVNAGFFGAQAAATSATTAAAVATTTATTASATAVTTTATEASAIAAAATARAAAQQAAVTAANTALSGSAKQAASIAAQKTAQAAATAVARQAAATSARQAAELAAKQAAEVAAQATAKAAARQAAISATKQLAVKQAQEVAAKQALQAAIKEGGNVAAKQALVEQASMARIAAQQAVKQTSENALKQSAELTAKQASYKITQANAQKALTDKGFKQAAQLAAKQSGTQTAAGTSSQTSSSMVTTETLETTLTNSQQIADKTAINLTKKEIAKQLAKNSMDEAAQTLKSAQANLAKDPDNVFAQAAVKAAQKNMTTATTKDALATSELTQAATTNSVKQAELTGIKSVANNSAFKDSYVTSSRFTTQRAAHQAGEVTDKEIIKAAQQIQNARQAELSGMSAYQSAKTSQMSGDTISQAIGAGIRQELLTLSFVLGQALNAGFGVFSALGAVNQDEISAMQAEQEKKSIRTLWRFVENNKIAITQEQTHFADELHKKHKVAVENQAFSLQYYKNFLNGSVNLVQQQIAQVLAQQQVELLRPDENGLRQADIGSSWGLQTKFVYLYPSQGFISTTLGRPNFPYAQEVAQAPLAIPETQNQKSSDLTEQQSQDTKLWFNQRAVAIAQKDPNKPLEVEIKFRIIYNLDTAYHVGLYLGGNYHDYTSPEYLQSLQDTGVIDTNETHLAKMFVIKRDNAVENPSLGVYENDGKEWIMDQPLDIAAINTVAIYHMRAKLDSNKLTVTFWQEDNPSKIITKIIEVTPCDQRTFGVIFSGAAVEWDVLEPNLPIIENEQNRAPLNRPTEIEREKTAKNQRTLYGISTVEQTTSQASINLVNPNQQTQNISSLQSQAAGDATIQITTESSSPIQNIQNSTFQKNIPNEIKITQQEQNLEESDMPSINQIPATQKTPSSYTSATQATQNGNDEFILAGNTGLAL